jgi:hypothetical protein
VTVTEKDRSKREASSLTGFTIRIARVCLGAATLNRDKGDEIVRAVDRCGCDHDGAANPHTLLPANVGQSSAAGALSQRRLLSIAPDRALPRLGREDRKQMRPCVANPNARCGNRNHDQRKHYCDEERIFDQRTASAVAPQTQESSPPVHFTYNGPTPKGTGRQELGNPS